MKKMDRSSHGSTPERKKGPSRGRRWLLAAGGLVAVAAALAVPDPALGNGGTLRLANVAMGEYLVSVFTDPTPVRPDSLDVSVLVLHQGREGVAEEVEVEIRAQAVDHAAPDHRRTATREQADDPRYYAAKFAPGSEGLWRIAVAVSGPFGEGEDSFQIRVREPGLLGHPLVLVLLALLPLAVAAAWILREEEVTPAAPPEPSAAVPAPPGKDPGPRQAD